MNLLWLVIVLISFHNVSTDPPALLSVEYTVKAYQSLDAGRQVAVLTGTFDQDVYANASCTSLATKTVYTRCCTDEIQTDCHLSVNPNNQCVDSQTILGGNLARSQGKTFEFHVQNYQSCDSVIFLARALSGDPDVFVSVRLSNTRPTPLAHNYRSEEMGSDAFLRCCSSILQSHPTWNGTVFVTVQSRAYSDASFEVLVHDDPARLSVTDFWWMSPVQVECSARNQTFSTRDCQYSELCMFFSPSDDPLFIYLATVTSRIYYGMGTMIDYNPRQISLGLVTKLVDLRYDPNVKYFPFPIELLSDPDCKVSFPTVMNIQGQRPTNSRPFSPRALSCSLEEFTNVTRGIENVITSLKTSNHTVQAVVDDHMYRAEALTINNAWIGCVEMVQRELLNDRVDLSYINQTRFCYATSSSSAEYLDDPCCNRALRNTMCCAPRDVLAPITRFAMHNDTINGRCNHPSCVRQSLEDFIVLAESTGDIFSGCSKSSFAALTDPIFTTDPWATCATTIYQATCTSNLECQSKLGIENSLCLGVGYCTIPCTSDDTCSTGSCVTVQNQRTCLLYNQNITADRLAAAEPMLTCLHKNLAPFAAAFIRQELNIPISASASEFKEHLGDALTGDTCVGFGSVSDAQRANQSLCLAPNSCNWAQCTDTSATCTQDNCLDSTMDAVYCQACFGTNCREVSSAQMCSYYTVTDEESCLEVNGHFNPLRPKQEQCIAANSTAEACFPPNFCSEEQRANNTCAPLCYLPSIVDEDTCSSTTLGSMALTWTNWTADFVTYGLCVDASINSRAQCYNASNGQATWWPGTQFTYEDLRTKAECESVGYCSPLGHDTYQDICLRTYYCDGCPTCTTQEACVQSGQCNNRVGCYVPFKATGGCDSGTWTPEGCLNSWNQSRCALEGARWVAEVYQDRATCLAAGSACVETVQLRGYWRTGGVTYKNQTECVECNGQWQSVYQFQEGRWRPSQFTQYSWTSRNFTTANRWSRVLNQNLFYAMHRRAAARRYSNILTTNIYCRYSKLISSLTPLACDCGEDRAANEACFASITQSVMSVIQACNNVPTEFNVRLGNVTVDQSFESRSSDCMDIPVSEVPQKQFLQRHLPTLSSVTVSLSQAGKAAQVRFIKNDNGVAVGEIVGDGLNISPPTTDFTGTIKVCLTLANLTGSGDMDIRVLDLATPNEAWNHFTPLGLNLTFTDNVACTEVPQSGLIVFPVGLIADWESAIFIETLHIGEILVIYLGSGLYLLVLAMTLYQMHHHIREHMRTKTKKFFKVGRLGLMILAVVLIDRFLYLMLLPNGILEQSRVADVLFSELPAMFYLCIYSLIVLRWAEICHFTMTLNTGASFNKLMPLVIAVNSVIAVAFVVLLVMFLVQPDNVNDVLSCASNFQLQKTTAKILAIVYRVVFSAFCLTFSILFAVYGGRIMQMIRESNKLALEVGAKDKVRLRNRKITTLITISLACTLCLLAQSACLLWISFNNANRSVIGILVFFYIVELGPAIIFIFLFKSTSIFAKFSRRKGWKKRSTEGGGGGSTSYSYQQLTENNSSK